MNKLACNFRIIYSILKTKREIVNRKLNYAMKLVPAQVESRKLT